MPKNDTPPARARPQPRSEMQRQSILDAASRLFIDKGFGGTNLNDIADVLGVSRTALYYYFASKESILEALTEEVTQQASRLSKSVSARDELPADEALRQLIEQHALLILTHPLQFRVVERSESSLPPERRAAAQAARRSVLAHFVRVIERGIDDGSFQAADARTAALSIIGMCNWTAWWFEPDAAAAPAAVAQQLAEFGLRALTRRRRATRSTSARETLRLLREQVDLLEAQLEVSPGNGR
jgi:AcrR family transcriptional regulator